MWTGLDMAMTVPVLTKFERVTSGQWKATMSFYVDIPNPPAPTESTVFLHNIGAQFNVLVT